MIFSFIKSLFSTNKMTDTAVDAIRKLGGLDEMNSEKKAKFLLDYLKETKHQSPTRRFIALLLTLTYVIFTFAFLVALSIGQIYSIDSVIVLAGNIQSYLKDILQQPINLLLSFYFVSNLAQGFKK